MGTRIRPNDMIGMRFGRLTVIKWIVEELPPTPKGKKRQNYLFLLRCACGSPAGVEWLYYNELVETINRNVDTKLWRRCSECEKK